MESSTRVAVPAAQAAARLGGTFEFELARTHRPDDLKKKKTPDTIIAAYARRRRGGKSRISPRSFRFVSFRRVA